MGNGVHHFNHLVPTIIRVRFAPSARLIHIVEVVKTVGLSHKAVLVQQKASGVHFLNVDFLCFLKEQGVD